MALINIGTADGSTLGNPEVGNYYIFVDSNNSNLLTRRDSNGVDLVYSIGESINQLGWIAATDTTYTSGSPLAISANTDTELDFSNDSIINTYAPNGYDETDFFDDVNNRILSPAVGYAYMFRLTFKCLPANNSRVLNVSYNIGTDINNQIIIDSRSAELRSSSNATNFSASSLIYSLDTFIANGMQIILNTNTNASVYDISMVISRIN